MTDVINSILLATNRLYLRRVYVPEGEARDEYMADLRHVTDELRRLSARDEAGAVGAIDENGEPPASGEAGALWPTERVALERLQESFGEDAVKLDDVVMVCAALNRLAAVAPPAASGDGIAESIEQMLASRFTLNDEPLPADCAEVLRIAARRLAAVAPAEEPPREYVQPDVINNDTLPAMQECMRCHRVSRADGPMLHMFGCKGENT